MHGLFGNPKAAAARTPAGAPCSRGMTPGGIVAFAYGIVAYAAFLASFIYAVLFTNNWLVPKTIDSGAPSPFLEALLVNGGILMLFAVQHTVMARKWFKAWWTQHIPASVERSTYVIAASMIIGALFWLWRPLPQAVWQVDAQPAALLLSALSVAGTLIALIASFMVDHFDLFGLRQVYARMRGRPYAPVGFRLRGLYRIVRHPLMVGFLISFWATPVMTVGHLLFALLTTAYIIFAVWVEERDLVADHGESYLAYRRSVGGFVPHVRTAAKGPA